jgi:hypothetical protein
LGTGLLSCSWFWFCLALLLTLDVLEIDISGGCDPSSIAAGVWLGIFEKKPKENEVYCPVDLFKLHYLESSALRSASRARVLLRLQK